MAESKITFTLTMPRHEGDDSNLTLEVNSTIEFDGEEDGNAPALMLLEEAVRTVILNGYVTNNLATLAPLATQIIVDTIAEDANDA